VIVPPVPTVETSTSTWPPVSSQISGLVVVKCTCGLAGLPPAFSLDPPMKYSRLGEWVSDPVFAAGA